MRGNQIGGVKRFPFQYCRECKIYPATAFRISGSVVKRPDSILTTLLHFLSTCQTFLVSMPQCLHTSSTGSTYELFLLPRRVPPRRVSLQVIFTAEGEFLATRNSLPIKAETINMALFNFHLPTSTPQHNAKPNNGEAEHGSLLEQS